MRPLPDIAETLPASRLVTTPVPTAPVDETLWPDLARRVQQWSGDNGVPLRDACWLLPFSALLPLARRALAALGGWQPRVETCATLARQLAPHRSAGQGAFGADALTNRLQAAHLLRQQAWGREWARRDARAFAHGVAALVDTAQALHDGAAAHPPDERSAWWQDARSRWATAQGPGDTERALARVALEWVAASLDTCPPDTDVLFNAAVSGWIALRVAGPDPLTEAVLAQGRNRGVPVLLLDLDPAEGADFQATVRLPAPALVRAVDAEAEARAATACVLSALQAHPQGTVALIAQDRETVRRVHALLKRLDLPVVDDTGWRVATTRAGARAMALLRAARSLQGAAAAEDARLDWLKDDPLGRDAPDALRALEAQWRGQRISDDQMAAAQALWQRAQDRLAPLCSPSSRTLADWLQCLSALWLIDADEAARWRDDAAGRAVLAALRLDAPWNASPVWQAVAGATRFDLDEFTAWVDEALDEASVVPDNPPEARVVITPLARVMLRPFSAVVCPGADERRLGVAEPAADLLGPAMAEALGLDGTQQRLQRQTLAFIQMLRLPDLTLLHRVSDGAESLGASPLILRLELARKMAGVKPAALPLASPRLPHRSLDSLASRPPEPRAGERWPRSLSASAVDTLRTCPYRFFSRTLLGLGEQDELDQAASKRDYGNWLHEVLMRFHSGRTPSTDLAGDGQRLQAAASEVDQAQGWQDGDLLPFHASFEALAPGYLRWLHQREAAGWLWWQGELSRQATPPELEGLGLHGRLDRLDRQAQGAVQLLDYKTGSAGSLKDKVKDPLEDTQLAFYAALALAAGDATADVLSAAYLALDDPREGPQLLEHPGVAGTAQTLLTQLGHELRRLRAGEPLLALGQGDACEHCEARGLCRRDHWTAPVPAGGAA